MPSSVGDLCSLGIGWSLSASLFGAGRAARAPSSPSRLSAPNPEKSNALKIAPCGVDVAVKLQYGPFMSAFALAFEVVAGAAGFFICGATKPARALLCKVKVLSTLTRISLTTLAAAGGYSCTARLFFVELAEVLTKVELLSLLSPRAPCEAGLSMLLTIRLFIVAPGCLVAVFFGEAASDSPGTNRSFAYFLREEKATPPLR